MSKDINGVTPNSKKKWSRKLDAKHRRQNALARLESQLKLDYKIVKVPGESEGQNVALTEKDKARINKEIAILKERV